MPTALSAIREASRPEVEAWLIDAARELEALDSQRTKLQDEVALARAWLGQDEDGARGDLALQNAMALILREGGNVGMRAPALAREINERNLYRMRDGRPVDPHQIHARVHNYPELFVRESGLIRLRVTH
jgi:hypothetical protein